MKRKVKRVRILLAALIAVAVFYLLYELVIRQAESKNHQQAPTSWLVEKYGPKLYSQNDEELIIRDFFNDRKNGFFADIGAGHYRINSTTYYLEKHLDWRGIAVDAIPNYERQYLEKRRNTRFHIFFVADQTDREIDFYMIRKNRRFSTGTIDRAAKHGEYETLKIPTITLNDLLEAEGVSQLDFLSMDIERSEPAALAGFDILQFSPSLVCIEAHQEVLDQILDYFQKNNYTVIEKYRGLDPLNLYFTPSR